MEPGDVGLQYETDVQSGGGELSTSIGVAQKLQLLTVSGGLSALELYSTRPERRRGGADRHHNALKSKFFLRVAQMSSSVRRVTGTFKKL